VKQVFLLINKRQKCISRIFAPTWPTPRVDPRHLCISRAMSHVLDAWNSQSDCYAGRRRWRCTQLFPPESAPGDKLGAHHRLFAPNRETVVECALWDSPPYALLIMCVCVWLCVYECAPVFTPTRTGYRPRVT